MIVRPSVWRDIGNIVRAVNEFAADSYARDKVDADHVEQFVAKAIRSDAGLAASMFEGETFAGCFIGAVSQNPLTGQLGCAEIFFYVEPQFRGHGKRLLKYVEQRAKERGCETFALSAPESEDRAQRVFQAWGYVPCERWFRKVL